MRIHWMGIRVWAFILVALVVSGCAVKDTGPIQSTVAPGLQATKVSPIVTPGQAARAVSPVETPGAGLPEWNSKPASGKAILKGRVKVAPTVLLGEIYLVKAMPTSNPTIDILELDEKASPRALIDRNTGEFMLLNVEPGKYGLIVWNPSDSAPVNDPKTGQTFFVTLTADQVTDVGTLAFP
jgi:hypothetical protein